MPNLETRNRLFSKEIRSNLRSKISIVVFAALLGIGDGVQAQQNSSGETNTVSNRSLYSSEIITSQSSQDDLLLPVNSFDEDSFSAHELSSTRFPTQENTPTPIPQESTPDGIRAIALQNINVRSASDTQDSPILTLPRGSEVIVIARNESGQTVNGNSVWYQIELPNGQIGWIWSGAARIEEGFSSLSNEPTQDIPVTRTPVPSETHVPTDTPEPTTTPTFTAPEVATVIASLDRTRFVDAEQLENYPRTIRYTNPFTEQEVSVNVDIDRLSQIITIDGNSLPLGVYDEDHPIPIDPTAFGNFQEWGGGDLRPSYIVGILTQVNRENDTNPYIDVALPLPVSRSYFPVSILMTSTGGRYCALDRSGELVPLPTNLLDDMGRIPYGQTGITYSDEENWISFPTSQGISVVRVGDPIIVRVVFNLDVYSEGYRQGFIVGSDGRLPEEVVADLYDNDHTNDGRWYQQSSALASAFNPTTITANSGG